MVPDVHGLKEVGRAISHTVHSSLFVCLFFFFVFGWSILNLLRDLFMKTIFLNPTLTLGDTLIQVDSRSWWTDPDQQQSP